MNHDDDDLRALYAGLAMMGLLTGRYLLQESMNPNNVAKNAVALADALIQELRSDSNAGEGRR